MEEVEGNLEFLQNKDMSFPHFFQTTLDDYKPAIINKTMIETITESIQIQNSNFYK